MIKILTKKGCAYCDAITQACQGLDIPYQLVYDHNEKIVPQGFDNKTGEQLFIGLPQFDYLKKLREKYYEIKI